MQNIHLCLEREKGPFRTFFSALCIKEMEWLGLSGKKNASNNASKKNAVQVDVTPSPATIQSAGESLRNAVKAAKQVAGTLKDVSHQLKSASRTLRKNAPALANVAADVVNDPRLAEAVEPVVGGANAAVLRNMPRSLVTSAARNAVVEAANQLDSLAGTADKANSAVHDGLNATAKAADWVQKNAYSLPYDDVNEYVKNNANRALSGGANGINSMVGGNVVPDVRLRANLGKSHARAVQNVARNIRAEASRKAERKAERKTQRKANRKSSRRNANSGSVFSSLF